MPIQLIQISSSLTLRKNIRQLITYIVTELSNALSPQSEGYMLELDVLDYQRKQAGQQNDGAGANAFGNKKAVIAAKGMVHLWKVSHSSFLPKKRKERKISIRVLAYPDSFTFAHEVVHSFESVTGLIPWAGSFFL